MSHAPTLGFGTYKCGELLGETLEYALNSGCKWIDTASNYEEGTAQRIIGEILSRFDAGAVGISSKIGFLPAETQDTAIRKNVLKKSDLVANHSLEPKYVRWQLERTLNELRRPCLDIAYLHNPELQAQRLDRSRFLNMISADFEILEEACAVGKVSRYGVATWKGFGDLGVNGPLRVSELVAIAENVAGTDHHFRAIQMPINLISLDPLVSAIRDQSGPLLECTMHGIEIQASSPFQGGSLIPLVSRELAEFIRPGLSPIQACLLVAASSPAVSTALISTSSAYHWIDSQSCMAETLLNETALSRLIDVLYGTSLDA